MSKFISQRFSQKTCLLSVEGSVKLPPVQTKHFVQLHVKKSTGLAKYNLTFILKLACHGMCSVSSEFSYSEMFLRGKTTIVCIFDSGSVLYMREYFNLVCNETKELLYEELQVTG